MENNVEVIAKDLILRAQAMAAGSISDEKDALHPEVDSFVRQMLHSCSELMFSCASLAVGPHELSVNILARSIIEMGIKTHWATMSADNAILLQDATKEQLKTIFKVNAKKGLLKLLDEAENDHTESFLANGGADKGAKVPSIETMATQCGLADIYNVFYRFQSLHAHVNDVQPSPAQTSAATLMCVGSFSILLGHIGIRWLVHRSRPSNEEIRLLLGVNSDVQP